MGGWGLEVGKMALYIMFPVTLFHFFNQPEYFEEWVTKTKRELYPPENTGHREQMNQAIRAMRVKKDEEMIRALEEYEAREKANSARR